ncbi:MAG: DOMON-like domain-containing protein [Elusimicrobiota bacterium]
MAVILLPFSKPPCRLKLRAAASFHKEELLLRYTLTGDIERVLLPALKRSRPRKDGLWKSTCFEAFLSPETGPGYWELNFSPSGAWNAYRFDGYRQGMREGPVALPPRIRTTRAKTEFTFTARIALPALRAVKAGLTSVLAIRDGTTTYWSLAHPAPKPDFHDPKGWLPTIRDP